MTVKSALLLSSSTTHVKPVRIVLAGGSGHVGTLLARHFHGLGHHVSLLARTTFTAPWNIIAWDGERIGPWLRQLEGAEVVINLAWRTVNCRYDRWNRREILDSRVCSTRALGEGIRKLHKPPRVLLNASTATIYRHSLDRDMDEVTGEIGGREKKTYPKHGGSAQKSQSAGKKRFSKPKLQKPAKSRCVVQWS